MLVTQAACPSCRKQARSPFICVWAAVLFHCNLQDGVGECGGGWKGQRLLEVKDKTICHGKCCCRGTLAQVNPRFDASLSTQNIEILGSSALSIPAQFHPALSTLIYTHSPRKTPLSQGAARDGDGVRAGAPRLRLRFGEVRRGRASRDPARGVRTHLRSRPPGVFPGLTPGSRSPSFSSLMITRRS